MFTHERHRALVTLLEKRRRASINDLLRALRVSPATLRRDLADLEAEGQLVRFHGGAAHPSAIHGEPSFEQKSRAQRTEKLAMAEAAAALVPPQQTVFLDAGTTCLEVGRALMTRSDLTIIASSVAFAEAARNATARVIITGGELRGVTSALVGSLALSWLESLRADWAFVGASGLEADGPSTTELGECAVKQALIRRAARNVLVADASKWGHPATVRFAGWREFDVWVTASAPPRGTGDTLGAGGSRIVRAKMTPSPSSKG